MGHTFYLLKGRSHPTRKRETPAFSIQAKILIGQLGKVRGRRLGGDPLQGIIAKAAASAAGGDHASFGAEDAAVVQGRPLGTVYASGFDIRFKQLLFAKHSYGLLGGEYQCNTAMQIALQFAAAARHKVLLNSAFGLVKQNYCTTRAQKIH